MYLLISHYEKTCVTGIFQSRKEATSHLTSLLPTQQGYALLCSDFEAEFKTPLTTQLVTDWVSGSLTRDQDEMSDYLSDQIHASIVKVSPRKLFDFVEWVDWDMSNLHKALHAVLKGNFIGPMEHDASFICLDEYR